MIIILAICIVLILMLYALYLYIDNDNSLNLINKRLINSTNNTNKITGMGENIALFIFRRDLRIYDNTAICNAMEMGYKLLPVFILEPKQVDDNKYKSIASIKFMINSIKELQEDIPLIVLYGDTHEMIKKITDKYNINTIFFNKDYTPYANMRDSEIENNYIVYSYHDVLLLDEHIDYKKFSSFYKKYKGENIRKPDDTNEKDIINNFIDHSKDAEDISYDIDIMINEIDQKHILDNMKVKGGRKEGLELMNTISKNYEEARDLLSCNTSNLSAHNKFGTISIRELYYEVEIEQFREQLFWRDFYYNMIHFDSRALMGPMYDKYDDIEWSGSNENFIKWCNGETGYPIIDACMRQLNTEHYMHNRGRMIVADFLIKLLRIDWRKGEKYFAEMLVDYDPAQNNYNWQWVAGTGPHSQPYFRAFNPMSQSKKHDPDCKYIKKYVPELKDVPNKLIHKVQIPVPESIYPKPIIDYKTARKDYLNYIKKYMKEQKEGGDDKDPISCKDQKNISNIYDAIIPYNNVVILPTQLFHYKELANLIRYSLLDNNKGVINIYIVEDPYYFTRLKFHKAKLIMHRASMKYYMDYIMDNLDKIKDHINKNSVDASDIKLVIHYIEFDRVDHIYDIDAIMFDPIDVEVRNKYNNIYIETPAFLTSRAELCNYIHTRDKNYSHDSSFYRWQRKRLDVLMDGDEPIGGSWTYDTMNREPFVTVEEVHKYRTNKNPYVMDARIYINTHFADNPGDDKLYFPITHDQAKYNLNIFLDKKIKEFGPYQDATHPDIKWGFHSQISSSLNNGLITPRYVLDNIMEHFNHYYKGRGTLLQSAEGFIRQLIGWREYCRMIYIDYELRGIVKDIHNNEKNYINYFGFDNKLSIKWWTGETGIIYVDYLIDRAIKYCYLNHIERLMYISNIMLLCEIDPMEVYEWFITIVSIDAYDWVMVPNIFGMGTYGDGGIMMKRPYYSSSSYVSKMSGIKDKESDKIWDALYYNFIDNNKNKLKDYRSRQWIGNYKKKSKSEKKEIKKIANNFLKNL